MEKGNDADPLHAAGPAPRARGSTDRTEKLRHMTVTAIRGFGGNK